MFELVWCYLVARFICKVAYFCFMGFINTDLGSTSKKKGKKASKKWRVREGDGIAF